MLFPATAAQATDPATAERNLVPDLHRRVLLHRASLVVVNHHCDATELLFDELRQIVICHSWVHNLLSSSYAGSAWMVVSPLYVVVIRSWIANSSDTHRVICQQLAVNMRPAHRVVVDHHMTEDGYGSEVHDRLLIRNLFWNEVQTVRINREELTDPVIALSAQTDSCRQPALERMSTSRQPALERMITMCCYWLRCAKIQ